jgi:two-component system, NarL family, sensor kinase
MGNAPKTAQTQRRRAEISAVAPDRSLSAAILETQDNERRKISRELHDSVGQSLVCLKISLEKFKSGLGAEESKALDEISRTVDEVIAEVRTVSHLLHPLTLDALGLRSSIMEYVKGFEERTGIQTSVEIPESLPKFEPATETALFRIVQECLTNVHKHAKATNVTILVTTIPDEFLLEITDDGAGFPDNASEGVALRGMRERVKELGGNFRVESGTFVGTSISACIPFDSQKSPGCR